VDLGRARQIQRSRIEVIAGSRAGEVVEEEHLMTAWTWDSWEGAIERSPFDEIAAFDGNETGLPRVERGATSGLLWHELALSRSQTSATLPRREPRRASGAALPP
jgi:hypothetical protein